MARAACHTSATLQTARRRENQAGRRPRKGRLVPRQGTARTSTVPGTGSPARVAARPVRPCASACPPRSCRTRSCPALPIGRRGGRDDVPGKLFWKLDPGAVDRLAAGCRMGRRSFPRRTARPRRPQWRLEILSPSFRLAHNRAGANLVSGVASALIAAQRRRARAVRGGRGGATRGRPARPPARCLSRQPLPRPARPLRRARARGGALARGGRGAAGERRARRQRGRSAGRGAGGRTARCRPSASTTRVTPRTGSSTPPTRNGASGAVRPTPTPRPTSAISATTVAPRAVMPGRPRRRRAARSS